MKLINIFILLSALLAACVNAPDAEIIVSSPDRIHESDIQSEPSVATTDVALRERPIGLQDGLLVKRDEQWIPASYTDEELAQPGMLCIRHKNYWCIKSADWNGEIGQDDRNHAIFSDAKFGARAFFRLMRNYRFRHGLKTTRQIFSRYAPFDDCIGSLPRDLETGQCPNGPNPTFEYAQSVAVSLGLGIDDDIELFDGDEKIDRETGHALARAVVQFELGPNRNVTEGLLDEGIALAGLAIR